MSRRAVMDVTHAQAEVQKVCTHEHIGCYQESSVRGRLLAEASLFSALHERHYLQNGPILAKRGYALLLSELGFYHFVLCIGHSLLQSERMHQNHFGFSFFFLNFYRSTDLIFKL